MNFPPSGRTMNRIKAFLLVLRAREERGASSSSPYHTAATCSDVKLQEGARADPMGTRWHGRSDVRYKPLVEVGMLANVYPAFIPGLSSITYERVNSYHFLGQFSVSREIALKNDNY